VNKISIIICSRTKTIAPVFLENIENTVGVNYELIVIDNSQNNYSIFEAYNLGVKKSKTDYLCFIHDDISFHTNNWGATVLDIFKNNKKIGLIGVAGAKVKTKMPSPWWNCKEKYRVISIIQHHKSGEIENTVTGFDTNTEQEVAVIDGVFMALRKSTNASFSNEIKGFHNYDLNLSLECKKRGYKVVVTKQILIEHYSSGTLNNDWVSSTNKIHDLYKSHLPVEIIPNSLKKGDEIRNAVSFMEQCLKFDNRKVYSAIWRKLFLYHPNLSYHFKLWKRLKTMRP